MTFGVCFDKIIVADTLRKYFSEEQVYRIGGDEFVVTSTSRSKEKMLTAVGLMRADLFRDNYEVSVGIETGTCGAGVGSVVAAAEQEMRNDKAAYYERNGDRRRERKMNKELEQMLTEKRDNERFIEVITRQFTGVYFVDLASDTARRLYNSNLFMELLKETNAGFSTALHLYVERYVKSEYRDRFAGIYDYGKLEQSLNENRIVEITYQKTNGDDMILRILVMDQRPNANPETLWMIWKKYLFD